MTETNAFTARQWWDADWFELHFRVGRWWWLAGQVPPAMRADFGWTFHIPETRCVA